MLIRFALRAESIQYFPWIKVRNMLDRSPKLGLEIVVTVSIKSWGDILTEFEKLFSHSQDYDFQQAGNVIVLKACQYCSSLLCM